MLFLAACGGGGGGGSSSPGTPPVNNPQPQAKVQTVAVQRALANQALGVTLDTQQAYNFGGGGSTSTFSIVRKSIDALSRKVAAEYRPGMRVAMSGAVRPSVVFPPCSNGVEAVQTQVGSAEIQEYERIFYDTACSQLHQDIFIDAIATSATAAMATGTDSQYTTTGTVFAYNTLQLSITGIGTGTGTFSVVVTDAASASAAELGRLGVACNVGTGALGCGFGALVHDGTASQDDGMTVNISASATTSSTGTTVPINGNGGAYFGPLNGMTLSQGTFPAWTLNGGSQVDSASFSGQLSYNTLGYLSGGTLTVSDSADDGTATITASGSSISGAVKQTSTGQTVATFTVDQNGNGTISYNSGATAQISDWQVIG
ncbi:MAG: hypothetical protein ACXVAC_19140 [Vulcanimicrobiaceae bacterium]